jgi:type IV pilus assembly protein PilZ
MGEENLLDFKWGDDPEKSVEKLIGTDVRPVKNVGPLNTGAAAADRDGFDLFGGSSQEFGLNDIFSPNAQVASSGENIDFGFLGGESDLQIKEILPGKPENKPIESVKKTEDFGFMDMIISGDKKEEKAAPVIDEMSQLLGQIEVATATKEKPVEAKQAQPQVNHAPLSLKISDKKTLHTLWMSFFKYGGLFIPTEQLAGRVFSLGASAMFRISLFDKPQEVMVLAVKAAWLTPLRSENKLQQGIGFSFEASDQAAIFKKRVDALIPDSGHSPIQSLTV